MRYRDIILARALGKGKRGMAVGWPLMLGVAGGGGTETTVTGVSPLLLAAALKKPLKGLTQYGLCTQDGTPTPDAPVPIMCNNGTIKYGALGNNLFDPNPSAITLGWYIAANNGQVLESQTNFLMPQYIPVVGGEKYVFYGRHKTSDRMSSYNRIAFYSANKTYISTGDYTKDKIGTGTAPSNAAYARLSCNLSGESAATGTPVTYAIIADYNWTFAQAAEEIPYEPFVGGIYTDGTPETLTICGNLITSQLTGYGTYVSPAQAATARAYKWLKDLPNGTYQFAVDGDYEIIIQWRDPADPSVTAQSYENLSGWITSGEVTFDKTTGGYGVAVRRTSGTSSITLSNFDGTLYCYRASDIQTASAPNLFAVGDYADEVEIISGGVTRRIGWHIFDGTETFGKSSAYGAAFYIQSAANAWDAQKKIVMCSHYLGLDAATSTAAVDTCFFNASGHFYIRVTDNSDTAAFKAWLNEQYAAGTPVILLYALATETAESVTAQPLHTNEGDNSITVTANVSPIELEATYMKGE